MSSHDRVSGRDGFLPANQEIAAGPTPAMSPRLVRAIRGAKTSGSPLRTGPPDRSESGSADGSAAGSSSGPQAGAFVLAGSRLTRSGSVRVQGETSTAPGPSRSGRGGDAIGARHGEASAALPEGAPRSPAASWSAGAGRSTRHSSVGSPSEAQTAAGGLLWASTPRQATPPPPLRRIGTSSRTTSQSGYAQMRGALSPAASAASSAAAAEARLGPALLGAVRSALHAAPVMVHVRCRPEVEGDRALAEAAAARGCAWGGLWADSERATISVTPGPASPGLRAVHFGFDAVIPAEATQEEVFKAGACGLVRDAAPQCLHTARPGLARPSPSWERWRTRDEWGSFPGPLPRCLRGCGGLACAQPTAWSPCPCWKCTTSDSPTCCGRQRQGRGRRPLPRLCALQRVRAAPRCAWASREPSWRVPLTPGSSS